jgi:hypothetical protein
VPGRLHLPLGQLLARVEWVGSRFGYSLFQSSRLCRSTAGVQLFRRILGQGSKLAAHDVAGQKRPYLNQQFGRNQGLCQVVDHAHGECRLAVSRIGRGCEHETSRPARSGLARKQASNSVLLSHGIVASVVFR